VGVSCGKETGEFSGDVFTSRLRLGKSVPPLSRSKRSEQAKFVDAGLTDKETES